MVHSFPYKNLHRHFALAPGPPVSGQVAFGPTNLHGSGVLSWELAESGFTVNSCWELLGDPLVMAEIASEMPIYSGKTDIWCFFGLGN